MAAELKQILIERLSAEYVRDDDETLAEYARDRTENPESRPSLVVFPGSVADVQAVLEAAREQSAAVYPVMASSNLGGLCIPVRGGMVINLERMNRILEVNEEDQYALIEPGVTWEQISKHLEKNHPGMRFAYPLSPPNTGVVPNCLMDGLANLSLRHGTAGQWINALEVVLPTGEILRTGHLAYGSDRPCTHAPFPGLNGLFTGFQGSTGVVVKMAVQLWPERKQRRRLFLMAYDIESADELFRSLSRLDLIDDLGSLSLATGKMLFGEHRPTFRDPNEPLLFVYLDISSDFESDFASKLEIVSTLVEQQRAKGASFDGPLDLEELIRLEPRFAKFGKFPMRLDFLLDHEGWGLTWVGTYGPVSRFKQGFERGAEILARHDLPPVVVARPMQGGHFCVLRWITVFDRNDPQETDKIRRVNTELADMAVSLGFFPYKTPQWAWERYGQRFDPAFRKLVRGIRDLMDPDGIMNPGHLELPLDEAEAGSD